MWRDILARIDEYLAILREFAAPYRMYVLDLWQAILATWPQHLGHWRDIAPLSAQIVAVFNGLVVVLIAFIPARRRLKLWIGGFAVALSLAAIGATWYSERDARERAAQERLHQERVLAERRDTRRQLDALIVEGTGLLSKIRDPLQQVPATQADRWALQAELLLRERAGNPYVDRFRAEVNPELGEPPPNLPELRLGYWRAVRGRVLNLERISGEFPK